jgi:hypothetical protein
MKWVFYFVISIGSLLIIVVSLTSSALLLLSFYQSVVTRIIKIQKKIPKTSLNGIWIALWIFVEQWYANEVSDTTMLNRITKAYTKKS